MAPFHGLGSTSSRLDPQGDSLRFTTKFPEIPGTHFTNLGRWKAESPCSHAVVLKTEPLGWETSPLTTRPLSHFLVITWNRKKLRPNCSWFPNIYSHSSDTPRFIIFTFRNYYCVKLCYAFEAKLFFSALKIWWKKANLSCLKMNLRISHKFR